MTNESADGINVGVALTTALLLPRDLERNAGYSKYENYVLMLQHSVQNREKLVDLRREVSALKKDNKTLLSKIKKLKDQVEAATKAQTLAEEKAESAEAIKTIVESQKKEAEARAAQAEKELQEALATKEAEIKEADKKAYAQGVVDVTEDYKLQVRQACNRGFSLSWMSLIKKLDLPADSPFRNADAIPLSFPPLPPPSQAEEESESESEVEDEDNNDDEALGDEVGEALREAVTGQLSSDLLLAERSLDKTLAEIDAELAAEKAAEVVPQESAKVQTQIAPETEES
ncbi:uncharacterized protein LOC114308042 [Camellia sinensis]|uniref:uncharacterized protein LOC114308042 n=1 Tax=Camellia sinensis TaxID=4442 RepID=UPI0010363E91|nr:uncharacterized protein LOC114308042 [Camellia sinensis]